MTIQRTVAVASTGVMEHKLKSSKKKTKTFTGCATCRSRKIKCDLGKPSCKRCKKSGFVCAGYTIQLCWSRPIQFDKYGYQVRLPETVEEDDESQKGFQRRNIEFVKYDREYETYEEMDRDLGLLHNPDYSLIENSETWTQGPFGVFEGLQDIPSDLLRKRRKLTKNKYAKQRIEMQSIEEITTNRGKRGTSEPCTPRSSSGKAGNWPNGNIFDNDQLKMSNEWLSNELRFDALLSATAATSNEQNSMFSELRYPFQTELMDTNSAIPVVDSPFSLPHDAEHPRAYDRQVFNALRPQMHAEQLWTRNASSTDSGSPSGIVIETSESTMPKNVIKVVDSPVDSALAQSSSISTEGLHISALTRYLLDHYVRNVTDLMTVIAYPKNPWLTIYFPRAKLALGDLAALGKSSNSRMSLLNALMAVSCFNLQARLEKGTPQMKFFLNLGIQFRSQASAFLKKMLQGELSVSKMENERYKDVIVAFLSMNTIDVVWGTMADCQYHLALCGQFISRRMVERPQLSNKAKSLHRIYSFLNVVQDSTNFQNLNGITDDEKSKFMELVDQSNESRNKNGEFLESMDSGLVNIEFVTKAQPKTKIKPGIIDNETSQRKDVKGMMLTEALYGLPNSLILFFAEAVKLVKLKFHLQKNDVRTDELKFKEICSAFEKKLLEWKTEWKLKDDNDEFISDMHAGLFHHTNSFHNGLIVYYFTMVRELGDIFLQKHCTDCITHLEKLQELNENNNVMINPLFWQGFITGCSSTDTVLHARFREWAAKLAQGGLGSYWGARQIMFEVWRRRKNNDQNDNWLSVHKDWEMNVMLP